MPRVLCTNCVPLDHLAPLHGLAEIEMGPASGELMSRAELLRMAPTLAGILNQGELRGDSELLDSAPQLRVVANMSIGTDNLDLAALSLRGVWATNVPHVFAESTADCAMGLMLAVSRRLVEADTFVRGGTWSQFQPGRWDGPQLGGRTLGIVGFGKIGRAVGRRAEAFGMRVVHHTRRPTGESGYRALDDLVREADVVCLCLPFNADSNRLFDAARITRMKRGAILINVARGKIVEEGALVAALQSGHLYGAGLDVFENEPAVHPALLGMRQVVMTPHLGGGTIESRRIGRLHAAANIAAVLQGQRPLSPVNEPQSPRT
jgi:glyoxylate reductase